MLNLCLCIDLILTIYDPFSPAYRRTKLYYLFSAVSTLVLVMIIFGLDTSADNDTAIVYDCIETKRDEGWSYKMQD